MKKTQAKVLKFEPREKSKLKSLNYIPPEKKELLRQREQQKKKASNRYKTTVSVGIFFALVALVAIIDFIIKR